MWWNNFWRAPPDKPAQQVVESTVRMPPECAAIWEKLKKFPIDDPTAHKPLSMRLAREQEWSHEHALRVVEEYRKFLFLCAVCPHMVTPSLQVDEAWHLHLLYTRSYLEELCLKTLGMLIHHMPSKGDDEEKGFADTYVRTLQQYTKYFGEPPEDIWARPGSPPRVAQCAAANGGATPGEPLPQCDKDLLTFIEQAAKRLRQLPS